MRQYWCICYPTKACVALIQGNSTGCRFDSLHLLFAFPVPSNHTELPRRKGFPLEMLALLFLGEILIGGAETHPRLCLPTSFYVHLGIRSEQLLSADTCSDSTIGANTNPRSRHQHHTIIRFTIWITTH